MKKKMMKIPRITRPSLPGGSKAKKAREGKEGMTQKIRGGQLLDVCLISHVNLIIIIRCYPSFYSRTFRRYTITLIGEMKSALPFLDSDKRGRSEAPERLSQIRSVLYEDAPSTWQDVMTTQSEGAFLAHDNKRLHFQFVITYGTHMLTSATYGGIIGK